jgi:hypothetical protein
MPQSPSRTGQPFFENSGEFNTSTTEPYRLHAIGTTWISVNRVRESLNVNEHCCRRDEITICAAIVTMYLYAQYPSRTGYYLSKVRTI